MHDHLIFYPVSSRRPLLGLVLLVLSVVLTLCQNEGDLGPVALSLTHFQDRVLFASTRNYLDRSVAAVDGRGR